MKLARHRIVLDFNKTSWELEKCDISCTGLHGETLHGGLMVPSCAGWALWGGRGTTLIVCGL